MIEVVPEALAGERLDRVVAIITGLSRSDVDGLIARGHVRLDGSVAVSHAVRVAAGATLDISLLPVVVQGLQADATVDVAVVYEDPDVLVIDKPPGLVVHPGSGRSHGTLVQGLLARYPDLADVGDAARPGVVHRLDKDTSGLLVVARTAAAHADLVRQLQARTVERRYRTLVWGHPAATQGMVDAPIGRSARHPTRMAVAVRGREARTRYRVDERFSDPVEVALLTCALETGRTHQIRVHLGAIGHAVVGDRAYGGDRSSFAVPRVFLHAAELSFRHPGSGAVVDFASPLPADLADVLARLA